MSTEGCLSPGVKGPGRESDQLPPFSVEVKICETIHPPHTCPCWHRGNFIILYNIMYICIFVLKQEIYLHNIIFRSVRFRITALGQVRCQNKRDTQHFGAGPTAIFRKKGQLNTALSLVVLSFHGKGEDRDRARIGHVVWLLYPDNEKCPSRTSMTRPAC
jgi:hypothetical protein